MPLDAVEAASPTAAAEVFADHLRGQIDAEQVSFLITDYGGQTLARLARTGRQDGSPAARGDDADLVDLGDGTYPYARAVVDQQVQVVPEGAEGRVRVLAPVTTRGDVLGVLELVLPTHPGQGTLDVITSAAHALAYVITTERRHTDLYQGGRRSKPVSLAAEIQRQLLPEAFTCEAAQFVLAAWLEPSSTVGGDTFDYALDAGRLYLSMTDAMGHGVEAALLATLTVGSLRNSRRAGDDLTTMARTAGDALARHHHGLGYVTGLLLSVDLADGSVQLVNAGHPAPLLVRDGTVRPVPLEPDLPLGVLAGTQYRVQRFQLRPGDRLVLLTDGMIERNARDVDLPGLLLQHRAAHPRQLMQVITTAVQDAAEAGLVDDATAMCLQWHGTQLERAAE
jgi:hypothetical protein